MLGVNILTFHVVKKKITAKVCLFWDVDFFQKWTIKYIYPNSLVYVLIYNFFLYYKFRAKSWIFSVQCELSLHFGHPFRKFGSYIFDILSNTARVALLFQSRFSSLYKFWKIFKHQYCSHVTKKEHCLRTTLDLSSYFFFDISNQTRTILDYMILENDWFSEYFWTFFAVSVALIRINWEISEKTDRFSWLWIATKLFCRLYLTWLDEHWSSNWVAQYIEQTIVSLFNICMNETCVKRKRIEY